jgi:hypothetical protein
MSQKAKSCPKCNGLMSLRLGEYECPQCRYTEPAARPPAEPAIKPLDYGGVKRARLLGMPPGGAPGGGQQSAAPGSSADNVIPLSSRVEQPGDMLRPSQADQLYTRGSVPPPPFADYREFGPKPKPVNAGLVVQKNMIFGTLALISSAIVLYLLYLIFFRRIETPFSTNPLGVSTLTYLSLLATLVVVLTGVLWYVVFSEAIWAKCTMIGFLMISLLVTVIGGFWAISHFAEMGRLAFAYGSTFSTIAGVGLLVSVCFNCWFIAVMYRDISWLMGNG